MELIDLIPAIATAAVLGATAIAHAVREREARKVRVRVGAKARRSR
jgi:hypothetical protein